MGIINEIERFAINDGPGIRTLIFFKGCPLRCKWCSNPETQNPLPEIYYFEDKCIFCQSCIAACPNNAIKADYLRNKVITNRRICTGCGNCAAVCHAQARRLVGIEKNVKEIMKEVKKDEPFYILSGGGVTLSGGEVFFQPDFALEILKACKKEEIDTAIETSGFASWKTMERLLPYIDHVLIDIKHMNSSLHKYWTGVSNELILENIKRIDAQKKDYIIRIPLIPGVNDGEENIKELKNFIRELQNIKEIHVLPYHTLGRGKYRYLEREYELEHLKKYTKEEIKKIVSKLEIEGVKIVTGG